MMAKSARSVAFVILIGVAARAVFAVTDGENSQSRNQCTTVLFLAHRLWLVLMFNNDLWFPNTPFTVPYSTCLHTTFCSASIFFSWIFFLNYTVKRTHTHPYEHTYVNSTPMSISKELSRQISRFTKSP
jgi:hypothetical protein